LKNKVFVGLQLPGLRYNFGWEYIDLLMSNLVLTRQDSLPIFRKH
jgi:hypothetical protein